MDRNGQAARRVFGAAVALRKEGVDRNLKDTLHHRRRTRRSPQGERG